MSDKQLATPHAGKGQLRKLVESVAFWTVASPIGVVALTFAGKKLVDTAFVFNVVHAVVAAVIVIVGEMLGWLAMGSKPWHVACRHAAALGMMVGSDLWIAGGAMHVEDRLWWLYAAAPAVVVGAVYGAFSPD